MTRECSGCGKRSCEGRCFSECPADYPEPIEEVSAPRPKFVPSAEYLAWLADLEPKKRPDGRWEIAA